MQLDYIIAGAQKSGTTTLHNLIRAHPDVFTPKNPQELHYFDNETNFSKGMPWFEAHFTEHEDEPVVGQTSPLYIYHPQASERIYKVYPNVKLIFILRNPVDRAYSHYYHSVKKGYEGEHFEKALQLEASRIKEGELNRNRYSYKDRGFYSEQVDRYLQFFDKSQIMILQMERLKYEAAEQLNAVFKFLGITEQANDIITNAPTKKRNSSKLPRSMTLQRFAANCRETLPSLSKRIDRLNLVTKAYPQMPDHVREQLQGEYREDMQCLISNFDLDPKAWF
jgi:hypothetical protein